MRYYIKDDGETSEDAHSLPKDGFTTRDPDLFAELAAQHEFDHHDGWERSWPIVITVINDSGEEFDYDVEMEAVPSFCATRCKKGSKT